MLFSLTNAPAVFQAQVNDVLRDMLNQFVFVYLDDILIFSKTLGYIVAKNSLQMEQAKVLAVISWPVPDFRKQLQCFLDFASFYRCFIRNYSSVAAPLTALTSSKVPYKLDPCC